MTNKSLTSLQSSGTLETSDTGNVVYAVVGGNSRQVHVGGLGRPGRVRAGTLSLALIANDSSSSAKTANTERIQEAVDYAYTNALQLVEISAGVFYCDPGIYLDAPGNLRSDPANPTIFNFSLELRGAGGLGNHEGHGTQLRFTDNSTNTLIIGTGQGMKVSSLSVLGPSGATSHAAHPSNGVGIALAGGSGGLSRVLLEYVEVSNFRRGVVTGYNADALCDSFTMFKCFVTDCYRGVDFSRTQNYINSLIECVFANNTTHVYSPVSKAVNVWGGNYSGTNAKRNAFSISSVSAFTPVDDNVTFTAVIASPDQSLVDGAYDAFAISTAHFGVVPLRLVSYNSGTATATFTLESHWLQGLYGDPDNFFTSIGDALEAELQEAVRVYACETMTLFHGVCFNVNGIHTENPGVLTTLLNGSIGFAGDIDSHFNRLTFNYDIAHTAYASAGTQAERAPFYCQQAFGFVTYDNQSKFGLHLSNLTAPGPATDRVVFDLSPHQKLIADNCDIRPNIRSFNTFGAGFLSNVGSGSTGFGVGEWSSSPFPPLVSDGDSPLGYQTNKLNHAPFEGYFPAQYATPLLTETQLAELEEGALPAVGSYLPICGDTPYVVKKHGSLPASSSTQLGGLTATCFVKSNHSFFSYGQNLTIDWNLIGGINGYISAINMDDVSDMFPGLLLLLSDGPGNDRFLVTGVYATLGYITAVHLDNVGRFDGGSAAGDTFSGSTVTQQAYSFSRVGTLPASKFTTNESAGAATASAGDLTGADFVNLLLTSIGAANFTTRTAAQMFGDIGGCYAGYGYMLAIKNTNAGTTTLNPGNGVTVTGTATIAQNTTRLFHVTFPTATTCTITSLGVTASV